MAKKDEADTPETRLARLILALRSQGVSDPAVLSAIETTPREAFTPDLFKERAFEDSALPIACGQTISQPFIVGLMTQALKVDKRDRVLEIGTGSGYQTTILSKLSRLVYTVERYRTLMREAEARFKALGLTNVITRFGDGGEGWPEQAPFDRILLTAAIPELPDSLVNQLKPGGILVAPVGLAVSAETNCQQLVKIMRTNEGTSMKQLIPVVFVPMVPGLPEVNSNDAASEKKG